MEQNNLIIDRRQASRLSALGIMLGFGLFASGYFLGKRHASQSLLNQLEKESLSDQVYSSMSNLYEPRSEQASVSLIEQEAQPFVDELDPAPAPQVAVKELEESYYALLASFRRMQDAQPLVDRLAKQGIVTRVKEVSSKSKQGRVIKWFQVVTSNFGDKQELENIVPVIKKLEKISDISIKKENKS